jgi:hypothetical protein
LNGLSFQDTLDVSSSGVPIIPIAFCRSSNERFFWGTLYIEPVSLNFFNFSIEDEKIYFVRPTRKGENESVSLDTEEALHDYRYDSD